MVMEGLVMEMVMEGGGMVKEGEWWWRGNGDGGRLVMEGEW